MQIIKINLISFLMYYTSQKEVLNNLFISKDCSLKITLINHALMNSLLELLTPIS